jgi:hypothetical protein
MTDAYVIEAESVTAGIAIRERGGFRFYASAAPFWAIDLRKYRRLREIHLAVRQTLGRGESFLPREIIDLPPVTEPLGKFVDCLYA